MAEESSNHENLATFSNSWVMPSPLDGMIDFWAAFFPLCLLNSLTRCKNRFVPRNNKRVCWYQCGPTVYDSSHLGHARTYVCLDIAKRIMRDFFGYNIIVAQNVTDIDDKIIIRANERNINFLDLASRYETEFYQDMRLLGVELPDIITRVSQHVPEIISFITTLIQKRQAYESNGSVYFSVSHFQSSGHTYAKLVPEQVGNTKLMCEGEGSLSQSAGGIASSDKAHIMDFALWKRSRSADEPYWESPWGRGRPGWHIECSAMSQVAFKHLSNGMLDIHAGGVDLKFPHHDNEIAQSEAYFDDCHQWSNYWLHTGHLNIKGFKMSKSLKNFISIRQELGLVKASDGNNNDDDDESHSARQIRLCFLLHKYNASMDYGDNTMNQALVIERSLLEFFLNVKAVMRECGLTSSSSSSTKADEDEYRLLTALDDTKSAVHDALADDLDTPLALAALLSLVKACNRYIEGKANAGQLVQTSILSVCSYISRILAVFGLNGVDDVCVGDSIGSFTAGYSTINAPLDSSSSSSNREQVLGPVLDCLTSFRSRVRQAASTQDHMAILSACDSIRDDELPVIGVRLEDNGKGCKSVWKLDDPAKMARERLAKVAEEEKKAADRLEKQRKDAARLEECKISPQDWFRRERVSDADDAAPKYSLFDESGLPTHDADGVELSKGQGKKLKKEYDRQSERFEKYKSTST